MHRCHPEAKLTILVCFFLALSLFVCLIFLAMLFAPILFRDDPSGTVPGVSPIGKRNFLLYFLD